MRQGGLNLSRRSAALGAAALAFCSVSAFAQAQPQKYPDVVGVRVAQRSAGVFDFDVTVSSPYDTPKRYADAFRVLSENGQTVYGVRPLSHDHAGEQPFTRDLYRVAIPRGVTQVVVQARDQLHGWGGQSRTVVVPWE